MQINEKIRILLKNNNCTQARLAELLGYSPDAVQKWVSGKNSPKIQSIKEICNIFYISVENLLDDNFEIPEYYIIGEYPPYGQLNRSEENRDSNHVIIEAFLHGSARLHRFRNPGGAECSAIYQGNIEMWWHYRENEARMIRDWNARYKNDR